MCGGGGGAGRSSFGPNTKSLHRVPKGKVVEVVVHEGSEAPFYEKHGHSHKKTLK